MCRWILRSILAAVSLLLIAGPAGADLPRTAMLATHGVGSLYNAMGTGIATVVSRNTPMTIRVQPFAGPPAWLPSMNAGETDMGVLTGADAVSSRKGIVLYDRAYKNVRLLLVGGALQLSFYVPKDSPVRTVEDLRGRRIPTEFPGIPIVKLSSTAALATGGLDYGDIDPVPVSDLGSGNQAFIEGRTDAGWHAIRSPAVQKANARRGGIRFISINGNPDGAERMASIYPGSYPSVLKAGSATGIVEDTTVLTNDVYLVASKELSDEAAYTIVKSMWEHNDELAEAHRALTAWRRGRMVSGKAFIPYHPGAIRFFREVGEWSGQMDDLQAQRMAE